MQEKNDVSPKKQLSRRQFLTLAGASLAASVLAACGSRTTPEPASPASSDPTAAPTAKPTEGQVAAADPTPTAAPPAEPPVNLTYHLMTWSMPDEGEVAAVNDAFNEILLDVMNATLTFDIMDAGSYAEKMQLKDAGGEQYDLCYTSSWMNPYYTAVKNGSYVPLDDLLPEYAPGLWASMPATTWEGARYGGNIHAVINQQIFASRFGFIVRKDYADKYDLDVESIDTLEDLEPFMEAVMEGEDIVPISQQQSPPSPTMLFDTFAGAANNWLLAVDALAQSTEVINRYADPRWAENMDVQAKWFDQGFYPMDPLTKDEGDANMKAGKAAIVMATPLKPGADVEYTARYGTPILTRAITPKALLATGGLTGTLTAVSRTTVSAEKAVQFLELVNTDENAYNLLCKGIEGRHWDWVDKDKKLIKMREGSGYSIGVDWEIGCQFNAYYVDEAQVGAWEAMKKANDEAMPSPVLGFAYNPENVENILPAVNEAQAAFAFPASSDVIPDALEALKRAGSEEVIADAQAQIDEWLKTRG